MKHGQEVFGVIFPTSDQPARIMQPGKEPLHFPAPPVAAQRTSVLRGRVHAAHVVRSDPLDAIPVTEPLVQVLAVLAARGESVPESDFGEGSSCAGSEAS